GSKVTLSRDQLYWYECERSQALKDGVLNWFLTNFCATPEESFQNTTLSPFSDEVIERHTLTVEKGRPYDFDSFSPHLPLRRADPTVTPWSEPRGIVWLFEK